MEQSAINNGVKGLAWSDARLWRAVAIVVGSMMAVAAILNFVVNPFKLYYLNILPPAEVNPRELKGILLRAMDPPPQVLILGSSRVMTLDPQYVTKLTGEPCFNFGGPSAMSEDYYATLRYAREYCHEPIDTVIVGVDLEALHPHLPTQPQGKFLPEYARFLPNRESRMDLFIQRVLLLFSLEQTGDSITALTHIIQKKTGEENIEYRPDGMALMAKRNEQIAAGTFDLDKIIAKRVRKYPARSLGLSSYTELGEKRKEYWLDFLEYCRDNKIRVYAFLTPYHPKVLELIEEQGGGHIIEEASEFLAETTADYGGTFKNFIRVENFGGDTRLFYDEIHYRPENGITLLNHLLGDGAVK